MKFNICTINYTDMEVKKKPEVDVYLKSGLFLNVGYVVTLLLLIGVFEWRNYDRGDLINLGTVSDDFEEIQDIPLTAQPPPPPPPPKIQQPVIIEVPDEEEIEQEIEIDLDIDIDDETVIEEVVFSDSPDEEAADEIFTIVEDQATPPGGIAGFLQEVGKRTKYTTQALRMNIEGRVYVHFVVEKNGTLTDVQAIKGIGYGLDEQAVKAIKSMPKWKPAKQRGRPVRQRMILPIIFKLN